MTMVTLGNNALATDTYSFFISVTKYWTLFLLGKADKYWRVVLLVDIRNRQWFDLYGVMVNEGDCIRLAQNKHHECTSVILIAKETFQFGINHISIAAVTHIVKKYHTAFWGHIFAERSKERIPVRAMRESIGMIC